MLSSYGKREWFFICVAGGGLTVILLFFYWPAAFLAILATLALLSFFRDPERRIPTMRGQMVSPADGRVRSIHDIEYYEPFRGPAKCIRIFLSVLDVHVNRSPCHGRIINIEHKPGQYLNALKHESAELNESLTVTLQHPTRKAPVAAVRQVSGAIARRIVCGSAVNQILQRGQRYGMIKFGSTTELYLPHPDRVEVHVTIGQRVYGGSTVLAVVHSYDPGEVENAEENVETRN